MTTLEGLVLRPLGREFVLIAEDAVKINFRKIISLNESAAFLWQNICGTQFELETLKKLLVSHYGIDEQLAERDARQILDKWIEVGIVVR